MNAAPKPLLGLTVVEMFGNGSFDTGRAAVSFAGMLVQKLGATVRRVQPASGDPMTSWNPAMGDGSSATYRFLTDTKERITSSTGFDTDAYLLTDDPDVFESWGGNRKVLVRASFCAATRRQSDLTIQATSGLLDIVGEPGRAPLPLPGYQAAYSAGLAAFSALMAAYCAQVLQGRSEPGVVAASEVAAWLNWKHGMASVSQVRETGVDRLEEWVVVRCRDGFVAVIFRDRDMPSLAKLIGNSRLEADEFKILTRRVKHLPELHAIIAEALAQRPRDEIVKQAQALSLPFAAVLPPVEVLEDPQMLARSVFSRDAGVLQLRPPLVWRHVNSSPARIPEDAKCQ